MKDKYGRVVVASGNAYFAKDISGDIARLCKGTEADSVGSWNELYEAVNENTRAVVFDRMFLGANFEGDIDRLLNIRHNVPMCVLMYDRCMDIFGYRLYKLGFNCLIDGYGETKHNIFKNFLMDGIKHFPEKVMRFIDNRDYVLFNDCMGKVSDEQLEMLRRAAVGETYEQIAAHFNLAAGTVGSHMSRLRKKIGAVNNTQAVQICGGAGFLEMRGGVL